jgi:hypothetical protein
MKVSGDLIVKIGLGVAVLGAVGLIMWKIKSQVPALVDAAVGAVNPADPNNLANKTVGAIGGAMVTAPDGPGKNADGSWSLGGWAFDLLNPGTAQAVQDISKPVYQDPYDFIFCRRTAP